MWKLEPALQVVAESAWPPVLMTTSHASAYSVRRQHDVGRPVGVEVEQEVVVGDRLAAFALAGDAVPVEVHADRLRAAVPVAGAHRTPVEGQPDDVVETLGAGLTGAHGAAGEEPLAAERRVVAAQPDHRGGEVEQRPVDLVPVHPADLGVLGVGVVVAALGAAHLVAVRQHRHALAEQQGGQEVALLAGPVGQDLRVVGRALDAVVPGPVVALAVVVVLAVGLVVLLVVRHEVAQREAVVGDDEVDAGERATTGLLVEVRGAGDPGGELAQRRLAAPEVAHRVPVGAVPLGPLRREAADLVAAGADVPGLGDQLDLADHRVLLHELEEGRQPVHLVELPGQGGGEVEAEAVDVHLGDPVAQRVHDQLQRVRVPHVERVAGAGVVHVVPLVVLDHPVVGLVVDALHAQRRTEVVALRGVVVDHVEDHLDAGRVQGLDHRLELLHLLAELTGGGVVGVRGEEAEGVVAPVVAQALVEQRGVVDELVHRHQLDRGDAELGEVLDDGRVGDAGVRAAHVLRHVRVQLGEPLDVGLVDDRLVVGDVQEPVALPVEERVDHDAEGHVLRRVVVVAGVGVAEVVAEQRLAPLDLAARRLGVRVEQQLVGVAPQALLGVPRAVHAVAVPLAGLDRGQVAVPHVGVDLGQLDPGLGDLAAGPDVDEAQLHALGDLAEESEVGSAPVEGRSEGVGASGPALHGVLLRTNLERSKHTTEGARASERASLPRSEGVHASRSRLSTPGGMALLTFAGKRQATDG